MSEQHAVYSLLTQLRLSKASGHLPHFTTKPGKANGVVSACMNAGGDRHQKGKRLHDGFLEPGSNLRATLNKQSSSLLDCFPALDLYAGNAIYIYGMSFIHSLAHERKG